MTHVVPPQLPASTPTRIAFVSDFPRHEEMVLKRPLAGPAGRVFNAALRNADLDRDEFLVTQVFDTEAPDDDAVKAGWLKDEVRVAESLARLNEELNAAQPTVIVPLGDVPLWAFTGQTAIKNFRGAVTAADRLRPGAKLLPTFHPEAVQRDWRLLVLLVADLRKAAAEAALGPEISYPKAKIIIEPTVRDVQNFVPYALASPKLSVDIETGWGQITAIGFAPTTSLAISIPFVDLRKANKSYWPTPDEEFMVWRLVQEMCEAPNPKVGQNFMYDLMWLYATRGIAVRNYRHDTRIRHKVLYPELPADLANMSASYTRVGAYKGWGGKYQQEVKKDG